MNRYQVKLGILSLCTILVACTGVEGTTPPTDWTRQIGQSGNDYAYAVAVDSLGNVVIAGTVWGSLAAENPGGSDAVVIALKPNGDDLWIRQFGTGVERENENAYGIAVNAAREVVVVGATSGSLVGASSGGLDAFAIKLDSDGNEVWSTQFGTGQSVTVATSVATDSVGNIVVVGYTTGELASTGSGFDDVFVRKYAPDGRVLWTRQFGTAERDYGYGVAVDSADNILVAGETGAGLFGPSSGLTDAFLRKYDSDGTELWSRQFGTQYSDFVNGLAVDSAGNAVVVGITPGLLEGSLGASGEDAFARKYDGNGTLLWSRQYDGRGSAATSVAVDAADNLIVAGFASSAHAVRDVTVRKFREDGTTLWNRQFGVSEGDAATAVAVDAEGNAFVVGRTWGSLAGEYMGGDDIFVIRIGRDSN